MDAFAAQVPGPLDEEPVVPLDHLLLEEPEGFPDCIQTIAGACALGALRNISCHWPHGVVLSRTHHDPVYLGELFQYLVQGGRQGLSDGDAFDTIARRRAAVADAFAIEFHELGRKADDIARRYYFQVQGTGLGYLIPCSAPLFRYPGPFRTVASRIVNGQIGRAHV